MKNESLYIRVIELALKYPEGFTFSDIIDNRELNLEGWKRNIFDRYFLNACQRYHHNNNTIGETIFLFIVGNKDKHDSPENKYLLTFEAEFTFIDYLELKFARQNAKEAKTLSIWAIVLSAIAILVSALIPFIIAHEVTQSVMIDKNQFQEIRNLIELDKK
ncbi:MAG: hypothetical protein RL641_898 [Candidatus Parcubacteria bacterium]|jgi:hypothetical protein